MRVSMKACALGAVILVGCTAAASAQQAPPSQTSPASVPATAPVQVPDEAILGGEPAAKLVLLFGEGAYGLDAKNEAILDQASRLYREGRPIIMVVTASTDAVGQAAENLLLSERRANAVVRGLMARGIPVERTQILAKGATSPAVPAQRGVPEPQNRRVEITWRR